MGWLFKEKVLYFYMFKAMAVESCCCVWSWLEKIRMTKVIDKVMSYTIRYQCGCDYTFRNMNDLNIDIQVIDHYSCIHHSTNITDNLGIT